MAEDRDVGQSIHAGRDAVVAGRDVIFSPSAAGFLMTQNPRLAEATLRQMLHDEALSALATAPADYAAEALKIMLKANENRAVALLADLHPRKATELIGLLRRDAPWLAALPGASEAITERAAELGWDQDRSAGQIEPKQGPFGRKIFIRRYRAGLVYWDERRAIHVTEPIASRYLADGGPEGRFSFPLFTGQQNAESSFGTPGTFAGFSGGWVYASSHGTYAVPDPAGYKYEIMRLHVSRLGFPVSDREEHDRYSVQRFEGGVIYTSEEGTFAVRHELATLFFENYIPISDEVGAPTLPFSAGGTTQRFRSKNGIQILVCSSKRHGIHFVAGGILQRYLAVGGTASYLGFPVQNMKIHAIQGTVQQFEGGNISAPIKWGNVLHIAHRDNRADRQGT